MSRASNLLTIAARAEMFAKVRDFFSQRNVLEVDCPVLSHRAPIDAHIDVMKIAFAENAMGFLHTSPEYAMKRLLASGAPDIYQMSHVFRLGDIGRLHNPEFMMIEWYRIGFSMQDLIEETLSLIRLFLPDLPSESLSYREAFLTFCAIDPFIASPDDLFEVALKNGIGIGPDARNWDRDTLLQLLFAHLIEPRLGKDKLTVLIHFPASQAALAQTLLDEHGHLVAERFEISCEGLELANGFHELRDAEEQKSRLMQENAKRLQLGKDLLPIDERFLNALQAGFPDCSGVAVGFDRLMLLKLQKQSLSEVLPFSWADA